MLKSDVWAELVRVATKHKSNEQHNTRQLSCMEPALLLPRYRDSTAGRHYSVSGMFRKGVAAGSLDIIKVKSLQASEARSTHANADAPPRFHFCVCFSCSKSSLP